MYDWISWASVFSKHSSYLTNIYSPTTIQTIKDVIMSTKSTNYTFNLSFIPIPIYTIILQVFRKQFSWTYTEWIKLFSSSVPVNIQNYQMFSRFNISVNVTNNKRRQWACSRYFICGIYSIKYFTTFSIPSQIIRDSLVLMFNWQSRRWCFCCGQCW